MATKNSTKGTKNSTKGTKAKDAPKVTKKKKAPGPVSFDLKVKGKKTGQAVSAVGADGVTRTRAQWNGYSLSGLLKWVGYNGGTIQNARQLVEALGLADVTSASTVSCQFYAGLAQANEAKCNHPGKPADVAKEHRAALKALAGM